MKIKTLVISFIIVFFAGALCGGLLVKDSITIKEKLKEYTTEKYDTLTFTNLRPTEIKAVAHLVTQPIQIQNIKNKSFKKKKSITTHKTIKEPKNIIKSTDKQEIQEYSQKELNHYLPISSKIYTYHKKNAYDIKIKGYNVEVLELKIYPKHTITTIDKVRYKEKKISLSIQTGVGFCYSISQSKIDFGPYIGIGFCYNF